MCFLETANPMGNGLAPAVLVGIVPLPSPASAMTKMPINPTFLAPMPATTLPSMGPSFIGVPVVSLLPSTAMLQKGMPVTTMLCPKLHGGFPGMEITPSQLKIMVLR